MCRHKRRKLLKLQWYCRRIFAFTQTTKNACQADSRFQKITLSNLFSKVPATKVFCLIRKPAPSKEGLRLCHGWCGYKPLLACQHRTFIWLTLLIKQLRNKFTVSKPIACSVRLVLLLVSFVTITFTLFNFRVKSGVGNCRACAKSGPVCFD